MGKKKDERAVVNIPADEFFDGIKNALIDAERDYFQLNQSEKTTYGFLKEPLTKALGVSPDQEYYITEKIFAGKIWIDCLFIALDDLKSTYLKQIEIKDILSVPAIPTRHRPIMTGLNKTRTVMTYGCSLCTDSDNRIYLIDIQPTAMDDACVVRIFSSPENSRGNDKLINMIDEKTHNAEIYKNQKFDLRTGFIDIPPVSWKDIVLSDSQMEEVQDNIIFPIKNLEYFEKKGLPTSRGILLEGPPGVGKTLLGQVLASTLGCSFMMVTPDSFGRPADIKSVFTIAQKVSPVIVFIEDIDVALGKGTAWNSVLSEYLNELDGIKRSKGIFTIMTSNRVHLLEKVLVDRPGRIDRTIHFDLPKPDSRERMLKTFIKNNMELGADVDFNRIATATDGYSGAHMQELVRTATIESLKEKMPEGNIILFQRHFDVALVKLKKEVEIYTQGYQ